ncbi:alpha-hydroxy-acid oxidizing protein [Streptomyces sp. NPDC001817]|uniref:alpha-hydroxy-acid oxidizing protein n=1 Tax=Streptomyces sp. NPDC001817 TaxID=3154398 RepID=UPI00331D2313
MAAAATGPLRMQLYWLKRRDLIRRAEAVGFRALLLTADAPRVAFHPRDATNGFAVRRASGHPGIRASGHPGIRAVNVAHDVMAAPHAAGTGSRPSPGDPRSSSTSRSPGRISPGYAKRPPCPWHSRA